MQIPSHDFPGTASWTDTIPPLRAAFYCILCCTFSILGRIDSETKNKHILCQSDSVARFLKRTWPAITFILKLSSCFTGWGHWRSRKEFPSPYTILLTCLEKAGESVELRVNPAVASRLPKIRIKPLKYFYAKTIHSYSSFSKLNLLLLKKKDYLIDISPLSLSLNSIKGLEAFSSRSWLTNPIEEFNFLLHWKKTSGVSPLAR